jgi:hypothetical protein
MADFKVRFAGNSKFKKFKNCAWRPYWKNGGRAGFTFKIAAFKIRFKI